MKEKSLRILPLPQVYYDCYFPRQRLNFHLFSALQSNNFVFFLFGNSLFMNHDAEYMEIPSFSQFFLFISHIFVWLMHTRFLVIMHESQLKDQRLNI